MWSNIAMGTRLNWDKNNLAGKPTRSLKDEREFHERDLAARWLERREKWEQTAAKIKQEKHAARAKRAKWSKPNKRKSHSGKAGGHENRDADVRCTATNAKQCATVQDTGAVKNRACPLSLTRLP